MRLGDALSWILKLGGLHQTRRDGYLLASMAEQAPPPPVEAMPAATAERLAAHVTVDFAGATRRCTSPIRPTPPSPDPDGGSLS